MILSKGDFVMEKFVVWEDRYSVGIKEINDQHKKLVDFTNILFESCRHGLDEANETFSKTLQEAVDYVNIHFTYEEKIMQQLNYPRYLQHKQAHQSFVQKVIEEATAFKEGKKFVPNSFVRFLKDWLLEHIAIQDQDLGIFLKAEVQKRKK